MFKALGIVTYTAIIGVGGILVGVVGLCSLMVYNNSTIDATVETLNKYKTATNETEVDSESDSDSEPEPFEVVTEEE